MATGLVVLDIQHRGKPDRPQDRGAVYGSIEETDLTTRYAVAADRELRVLGHDCILISDGRYRDRAQRAHDYGADVVIACHVNAGRGDRGEVYHDHRSSGGLALASTLVEALRGAVPWMVWLKAARPDGEGAKERSASDRAYWTIQACSPLKPVGICYEPGFIDSPDEEHRNLLLTRPEVVGVALARGIDAWMRKPAKA